MKLIRTIIVFLFLGCCIGAYFVYKTESAKGNESHISIYVTYLVVVVFIGIVAGAQYAPMLPRIKYIESNDIKAPVFSDRQERVIIIKNNDFSFERLQAKIAQKWILTSVDNDRKILKFKTKVSFFNWGIGCYLAFDPTKNTILLASFLYSEIHQNGIKLKTKLNDQVEDMIMNSYI